MIPTPDARSAEEPQATPVENFPYAAIEEAVTNAVYHRGYDVREPVEVRISRNELVVRNSNTADS